MIYGALIEVKTCRKIGNVNISVLGGYTYIVPLNMDYNDSIAKAQETFTDTMYSLGDIINHTLYGTAKTPRGLLKYRYQHTFKMDVQCDYKRWSMGMSMRYNSFMKNIDRKFQDPLLVDILPGQPPDKYKYILRGLKEYREQHNKGDIVLDCRVSYEFRKGMRAAVLVNNILNREYLGRPGDVQPPRTFGLMLSMKI